MKIAKIAFGLGPHRLKQEKNTRVPRAVPNQPMLQFTNRDRNTIAASAAPSLLVQIAHHEVSSARSEANEKQPTRTILDRSKSL